jgi:plasmid stabilization system protein ParE
MPTIILSPRAETDIEQVLSHTHQQWGTSKYLEYCDLIQEAYEDILANPTCGRVYVPKLVGIRGYAIEKPGRNARHIVFYRVTPGGDIEVVRFLYDAMDHQRHI